MKERERRGDENGRGIGSCMEKERTGKEQRKKHIKLTINKMKKIILR